MLAVVRTTNLELVMKAVQLSRFGNPEVLQLIEIPTPKPGPGEVLVRIRAGRASIFLKYFYDKIVMQSRPSF